MHEDHQNKMRDRQICDEMIVGQDHDAGLVERSNMCAMRSHAIKSMG